MVTTGQLTGLIMAIVLPILAGAVPFFLFWKRSSRIENGMVGAVAYGIVGYFWQGILYSVLSMIAITSMVGVFNTIGSSAILVAIVEALLRGIFVILGLYWGVYLTNTKQRSLYRSASVGIGFGIGDALLSYGFQLYYAVRINLGIFTGGEEVKTSILSTSMGSLCVGTYRGILMVIIFMGMALVMGDYYLEKKFKQAWGVPLIVYVFLRFTEVILNTYISVLITRIIMCVLLTVFAVAALWIVRGWLQTGKVTIKK